MTRPDLPERAADAAADRAAGAPTNQFTNQSTNQPTDQPVAQVAALVLALVLALADALRARGACIVTAESCTGGLIAGACTELAGSSDWFDRGFVTYSNAAKTELLGVDAGLIAAQGAVSEPVARAMAAGALVRSPAALTVAVTGVAGPGGGSLAKPVGRVWLAWAWHDAAGQVQTDALLQQFDGDRAAVRQATVAVALQGLLARVPALPEATR